MQTAVSGASAPSSLALTPPMPEHDPDAPTPDQLKILREWDAELYRIVVEGGTDEERARIAARAAEVLPPPGPAHAIRNALQILESGGLTSTTGLVTFEAEDLDGAKRLLMTALERDAAREALTEPVSLEDSVSVQQLVDEFEAQPHRFAVRFMNAVEYTRQLTRRLDALEARLRLVFPRPMGAPRS